MLLGGATASTAVLLFAPGRTSGRAVFATVAALALALVVTVATRLAERRILDQPSPPPTRSSSPGTTSSAPMPSGRCG
ncbi:hypothetical protein [Microbacterium sp. NIBRBAC000506063]|uniref:hypothetical protein n=1 Tax=Microbacterium sp. NIBRBAC000506063 TaxID=2734618 RepID=UPI001BB6F060|nr:hypothetical protein [Microbacterium sp. NIBRBAC000506063]QTV80947.1 hypothetical protein KAE78_14460 [Microbacterium sp. NIBRBAC000506063]